MAILPRGINPRLSQGLRGQDGAPGAPGAPGGVGPPGPSGLLFAGFGVVNFGLTGSTSAAVAVVAPPVLVGHIVVCSTVPLSADGVTDADEIEADPIHVSGAVLTDGVVSIRAVSSVPIVGPRLIYLMVAPSAIPMGG